ncbi:MAG: hypothetical protein LZF61_00710 [Nitrosomonas sp.]|nr:MAG: hypothetical protein LZF61_00710 [Nitrosomonas sp.]
MQIQKLSSLMLYSLFVILVSGCQGPPGPPGIQGPPGPGGAPYPIDPVFSESWSGVTAGAAAGYCLAKHPYQSNTNNSYTDDGYEKAGSPGIVGVVRRNYVHGRASTENDAGASQSCEQACREMGKRYEPTLQGKPLHQKLSNGSLIVSGIGDMASDALPDYDFYTGKNNIAGMISRANTYHTQDVAQADFCCCHVITPR